MQANRWVNALIKRIIKNINTLWQSNAFYDCNGYLFIVIISS